MVAQRDAERFHAESAAEWRAWLASHPGRTDGVWLVTWRASSGRPLLNYEEAIQEALCFGWVDGTGKRIDDERTMLWFAPRRKGSTWARTNKARVERLERDGRMTDAGRRVIERAKADGTWTVLESADDLLVPDDLTAAFAERPGSREQWDSFPPSTRKSHLGWIALAKAPATRARRTAEIAEKASRGERAGEPPRPETRP